MMSFYMNTNCTLFFFLHTADDIAKSDAKTVGSISAAIAVVLTLMVAIVVTGVVVVKLRRRAKTGNTVPSPSNTNK